MAVTLLSYFTSFFGGPKLIVGAELGQLVNSLFSVNSVAYTAFAGGGQANATPLKYGINRVGTVATNADSVMLPPAIPGSIVRVANDGASTLQVFGQLTETIAPQGTVAQAASATGVAQLTGVMAVYACMVSGRWKQGSVT